MSQKMYDWLAAHPAVADCIVWQGTPIPTPVPAGPIPQPWPLWDATAKMQLDIAFEMAEQGQPWQVNAVPPNQVSEPLSAFPTTVLAPGDALSYYLASVAQALVAEIHQQLPWSLCDYNFGELAHLFNSLNMFAWNEQPPGYVIDKSQGAVIPAPPAWTLNFVKSNHLLGSTRLHTIAALIEWCRNNLCHYSGISGYAAFSVANMEASWQYSGFPPMTRVIEGTVSSADPSCTKTCWTAGCWGTVGLLRAALRAVSIPAALIEMCGHAQANFVSEAIYLCHGDDPYCAFCEPPVPVGEIPINQADYDAWFGAAVAASEKKNNISRRSDELAIAYLPNYLLGLYCQDKQAGLSHAAGQVYANLSPCYTLAQLDALNLWSRMDAKLASIGGCAAIGY
jgi:hypothetical protein